MIKNIIFDVGKVLLSFDTEKMMTELGFTKEEREQVNKAMFHNELWNEYDRGTVSAGTLLDRFIQNAPLYEDKIRLAFESMPSVMDTFGYVHPWLDQLKRNGMKLYVLSNYARRTMDITREKLTFMLKMDGAVFSYECQSIKPERGIYETLFKMYDLRPEECIFIDDRPENIEAGKKLGMDGIVFHSYEQAAGELEGKLLSAPDF